MDELIALERQGWDALSAGRAAEFYTPLLAPEALVIVPGMVLDREQTLAGWADAPPWQAYELTSERVLDLGPETRAVTYYATARRTGEPPYLAQLTTVYVRRDGRWRLTLHQQTPWPAGDRHA